MCSHSMNLKDCAIKAEDVGKGRALLLPVKLSAWRAIPSGRKNATDLKSNSLCVLRAPALGCA